MLLQLPFWFIDFVLPSFASTDPAICNTLEWMQLCATAVGSLLASTVLADGALFSAPVVVAMRQCTASRPYESLFLSLLFLVFFHFHFLFLIFLGESCLLLSWNIRCWMLFYGPTLWYLRVSTWICLCCLHLGACGFLSATSQHRLSLTEVPKVSIFGIFSWILCKLRYIRVYWTHNWERSNTNIFN